MHSHGMKFIGSVFPSPKVEGKGEYRAVQVHQQNSSQPRGPMGAESQPTLCLVGWRGTLYNSPKCIRCSLSPAPLGPCAQVGEVSIPHLSKDAL